MKYIIYVITLAVFLSCMETVKAQSEKQIRKFEKELFDFKYSLYPYLEKAKNIKTFFSSDINSIDIIRKAKDFSEKNRDKIIALKTSYLKKYMGAEIDMSYWKEDSTINQKEISDEIDNIFEEHRQINQMLGAELESITNTNPIHIAYSFRMQILIVLYPNSEYGAMVAKDMIAAPKIKCTEISEGIWKIFIDNYSYCFEFDYKLKDNFLSISKVYKRRNT